MQHFDDMRQEMASHTRFAISEFKNILRRDIPNVSVEYDEREPTDSSLFAICVYIGTGIRGLGSRLPAEESVCIQFDYQKLDVYYWLTADIVFGGRLVDIWDEELPLDASCEEVEARGCHVAKRFTELLPLFAEQTLKFFRPYC